MNEAYLCLGGNLGDREVYLKHAIIQINLLIGTVNAVSSIYETEAWGVENQAAFLNCCIKVSTSFSPQQLIKNILQIEEGIGRVRDSNYQYSARVIDIDILFYNEAVISFSNLEIPHPRLHLRKFVLLPLLDITQTHVHPILSKNIDELMRFCEDSSDVKLYKTLL